MASPNRYGQYYNEALGLKAQGTTSEEIDGFLRAGGIDPNELKSWADSTNNEAEYDNEGGIGVGSRLAASGQDLQGQLATFQGKYPSARMTDDNRIVYMNPETNRWTYADPSPTGVTSFIKDLPGDTADVARDLAVGAGGGLGGAAGSAVMVPSGPPGMAQGYRAGMGIGAGAAGQAYDSAAKTLGGRVETRKPAEQLKSAATEIAMEPLLQAGADKALRAVPNAYRGVKRMLQKDAPERLAAARRHGIENLTAGQLTKSPNLLFMEDRASKGFGGRSFRDYVGKGREQTAEAIRKTVSRFGDIKDPEALGAMIKDTVPLARLRLRELGEKMFVPINEKIGERTPVSIGNFLENMQKIRDEGVILSPNLKKFEDNLISQADENVMVPWNTLRKNRSWFGDVTGSFGDDTFQGVSGGHKDLVYGGLSEDMREAARAAGIEKQFDIANKRYSTFITRNKPILDEIQRKGYPDEAWGLVQDALNTGKFDKLRALEKQMTKQEWKATIATALNRLGKALPGAQDAAGEAWNWNTFATNWSKLGKLSPKNRHELFKGVMDAQTQRDFTEIAELVFDIKDTSKFQNFSNTAASLGLILAPLGAGIGAMAGGPVGAGVGSVAGAAMQPYVTGRLLRSKRFINWLGKAAKLGKANNERGLSRHMIRLGADVMAGLYGEEEGAVLNYLKTIDNIQTQGDNDGGAQINDAGTLGDAGGTGITEQGITGNGGAVVPTGGTAGTRSPSQDDRLAALPDGLARTMGLR